MKKIYVLLTFLLTGATLLGQSVSPLLIGSGGGQTNNANYQVSWSVGEVVTGVGTNGNILLTQGFQQGSSIPPAPVATPATAVTPVSFAANWDPVIFNPLVTVYFLDVSTTIDFLNILPDYNNRNVGNVTTFPVTGLSPGKTYYYRLRAENSEGVGPDSNIITVTQLIPTLSEWGLIIFGIMLVAISTVYILKGYGHSA